MREQTKVVYYCEFCKKYGLSKGSISRHEKLCFHNPNNIRPCLNCAALGKREEFIEYNYPTNEWGNQGDRIVSVFYCKKKNINLHPPQVDIKKNHLDVESESMPIKCELFSELYEELFNQTPR